MAGIKFSCVPAAKLQRFEGIYHYLAKIFARYQVA